MREQRRSRRCSLYPCGMSHLKSPLPHSLSAGCVWQTLEIKLAEAATAAASDAAREKEVALAAAKEEADAAHNAAQEEAIAAAVAAVEARLGAKYETSLVASASLVRKTELEQIESRDKALAAAREAFEKELITKIDTAVVEVRQPLNACLTRSKTGTGDDVRASIWIFHGLSLYSRRDLSLCYALSGQLGHRSAGG